MSLNLAFVPPCYLRVRREFLQVQGEEFDGVLRPPQRDLEYGIMKDIANFGFQICDIHGYGSKVVRCNASKPRRSIGAVGGSHRRSVHLILG